MNHEIIFGIPLFRYYLDPTKIKEIAETKFKNSQGFPLNETPGGWDCTVNTDFDNSTSNLYTGFYDDIMTIAKKLPKKRQNLLFSATMPSKIRQLANKLLNNPASISLAISKPAAGITQSAYMCYDNQKVNLVREILKEKGKDLSHVLIFASSIKSVREIKKTLNKSGMRASEMHSGLEQEQREKTIREFKS